MRTYVVDQLLFPILWIQNVVRMKYEYGEFKESLVRQIPYQTTCILNLFFLKCISIFLPELGVFLLYFTNKTKMVMELKMYLESIRILLI